MIALVVLAGCSKAPPAAPPEANGVRAEAQAASAQPAAKSARHSAYTTLDMGQCKTIEENKEEGPYWLGRCPGHAGWQIEWSESDLRQDLTLIDKAGRKTRLGLSGVVAEGAFNSMNGGKIEWRGGDPARPDALIVRMNVDNPDESPAPDISKLAVIRLAPKVCVIGVIGPGADQNERARAKADEMTAACLAG
jgi:hypothetical protein